MKPIIALAILAYVARAQVPTPPEDPPEIPPPETDLPPPSDEPPADPVPPPETSPGQPEQPAPSTILTPPVPTTTGDPVLGPICECGYTYCASVLTAMVIPWSEQQLAEAYCSTDKAPCGDGGVPATNVSSALYICLCDDEADKVGTNLDLICGCDECLILAPDYRGRCKTPCSSGSCGDGGD